MRANRTITVDLVPGGINERLRLSQYDTDYNLVFSVYDAGIAVALDSGATVTLEATKPSGLGFSVAGTWYQNVVTVPLSATMTEEAGRFPAELVFMEGDLRVGSANFEMWVEDCPHPAGTTDGDTETARTLLEQMQAAVVEAEAAAGSVSPVVVTSTETEPSLDADPQYIYEYTNPLTAFDLTPATDGITSVFFTSAASGCTLSIPDTVLTPPGLSYTAAGGYKTINLPANLAYELDIFHNRMLLEAWT